MAEYRDANNIPRRPLPSLPNETQPYDSTHAPLLVSNIAAAGHPWLAIYPIVLYITPLAKPSITENEGYQFGALRSRDETITHIRVLAEALCEIKDWRIQENFADQDVLWCYLWKLSGEGKGEGETKGGEEESKQLMGWFAAERVWLRKGGADVKREMEGFLRDNLPV